MVETEFAVITFIDDAVVIRRSEFRDIALILINPIQQGIEGWTEIETSAAAVAHVVDAQCFLFEGCRIDGLKEAKFFHGWEVLVISLGAAKK